MFILQINPTSPVSTAQSRPVTLPGDPSKSQVEGALQAIETSKT